MLAHDVSPPWVTAELTPAKLQGGIEFERNPARLVPPIFKESSPGAEEFLAEDRIESVQPRQKNNRVTPCAGDRDGVELEVSEAPDVFAGGVPGTLPLAFRPLRKSDSLALRQARPCQRESAYGAGSRS